VPQFVEEFPCNSSCKRKKKTPKVSSIASNTPFFPFTLQSLHHRYRLATSEHIPLLRGASLVSIPIEKSHEMDLKKKKEIEEKKK
jgi:hypothetical protein